jgi:hypothetical protein
MQGSTNTEHSGSNIQGLGPSHPALGLFADPHTAVKGSVAKLPFLLYPRALLSLAQVRHDL